MKRNSGTPHDREKIIFVVKSEHNMPFLRRVRADFKNRYDIVRHEVSVLGHGNIAPIDADEVRLVIVPGYCELFNISDEQAAAYADYAYRGGSLFAICDGIYRFAPRYVKYWGGRKGEGISSYQSHDYTSKFSPKIFSGRIKSVFLDTEPDISARNVAVGARGWGAHDRTYVYHAGGPALQFGRDFQSHGIVPFARIIPDDLHRFDAFRSVPSYSMAYIRHGRGNVVLSCDHIEHVQAKPSGESPQPSSREEADYGKLAIAERYNAVLRKFIYGYLLGLETGSAPEIGTPGLASVMSEVDRARG